MDMPPPQLVVVERAADAEPLIFMGVVATGTEAALAQLGTAARAAGLQERSIAEGGFSKLMVGFAPGTPQAVATQFYRDAQAGKYGSFGIEVVVTPVMSAADGIDWASEVETLPPEGVRSR